MFGRNGQLIRQIGDKGQGKSQFLCPEGITVLQSRNWIYVADTGNDRIQILGVSGDHKGGIGLSLDEFKQRTSDVANLNLIFHRLKQPTDVAVSDSTIVVADSGNNKIKVRLTKFAMYNKFFYLFFT